jgi:hypothetical protein
MEEVLEALMEEALGALMEQALVELRGVKHYELEVEEVGHSLCEVLSFRYQYLIIQINPHFLHLQVVGQHQHHLIVDVNWILMSLQSIHM